MNRPRGMFSGAINARTGIEGFICESDRTANDENRQD